MTTRPGFRLIESFSCGWALHCDVSDPKARPYFINARGDVRKPIEVASQPEAQKLYHELRELWTRDRAELRGPWREDPRYRSIDYARDALRFALQMLRRWDPALDGKAA